MWSDAPQLEPLSRLISSVVISGATKKSVMCSKVKNFPNFHHQMEYIHPLAEVKSVLRPAFGQLQ